MSETDNIQANIDSELPSIGRRPGKPKGLPKPTGSGRKPGTPNHVTRDVRAAAAKHSTKAIAKLVKLLDSADERIVATAAREILDRAHGKPMQATEITGKDGAPLNEPKPEMSNMERAKRLLFMLSLATKEATGTAQQPRSGAEASRMLAGTWQGVDADPEATVLDLTPSMLAPSNKPGWSDRVAADPLAQPVTYERTAEDAEAIALHMEEARAERRDTRQISHMPNVIRKAPR